MEHTETHRYIDVLPEIVRGYNDAIHSTTGMAPSNLMDSDILAIWKRMLTKHRSVMCAAIRFIVGQHVQISKEILKIAKSGDQNYTTEIFRIYKVVPRFPRPVNELQDLLGKHVDRLFYAEELSPVLITKMYAIDKILRKRDKRGII